jgi:hypothetical protein
LLQKVSQFLRLARIDQVHRSTKRGVFDAFVVRKIELIGESWLLYVPLQPGPTGKSMLTRYGQLRVAKTQGRAKDFSVSRMSEARMELANLLGSVRKARSVLPHQVTGLVLEMVEVWIGGETSYRHNELPFVLPEVRNAMGRK